MRMYLVLTFFFFVFAITNQNEIDNEIFDNELEKSTERISFQVKSVENERNVTLEEIFNNAVQSYLDENWTDCISEFNEALRRYKEYKRMIIKCRKDCRISAEGSPPIFPENIDDLHFYEKKVKETLCLLKCNQNYQVIARTKLSKQLVQNVEIKFVEGRPYEYLHICYYQKARLQEAANAIFTFLVLHPKHEMSIKNLRFYLSFPEVKDEEILNLEADPFVEMYVNGVLAYDAEDYVEAVGRLEHSLLTYIKSEEECRFYCEGSFDQGWHPEFTSSIANHFTYCLKCKRGCSQALNNLNGKHHYDLLPSHYHYLQFAYYKLGKLKEACAAVESYLLFFPADETMLQNKDYYSVQPKVEEKYFAPREEALSYVKRQEYELRLLNYISNEFEIVDIKLDASGEENTKKDRKDNEKKMGQKTITPSILHPPPGHSPSSYLRLTKNASLMTKEREKEREKRRIRKRRAIKQLKSTTGIRVIAGERELGGKWRYTADGFMNSTECNLLMQLAQIGAVEGDGYEENKSPHSIYEKFEGVTLGRAALMVYFGLIEPELLTLFLRITEAGRDHVERYFNLDQQLHFTYTHLVCRSALPDSPLERKDLSHAIHADNCLVNDSGDCIRENPAYTWRDYSAIIYLNDNFEGGEFVFAKDSRASIIQGIVRPCCGRMVAFSADGRNLHGVRGIVRGKRCALALWFTHEEKYLEIERTLARAVLKRVRSDGSVRRDDVFDIPARYEEMLIDRFREDETLGRLLEK